VRIGYIPHCEPAPEVEEEADGDEHLSAARILNEAWQAHMASDDAKLMLIGHLAQQVEHATRGGRRAKRRRAADLILAVSERLREAGNEAVRQSVLTNSFLILTHDLENARSNRGRANVGLAVHGAFLAGQGWLLWHILMVGNAPVWRAIVDYVWQGSG